jgi:hypothetical protein
MPCQPLSDSDFNLDSVPGFHLGSISLPELNIPFPDLPLDDLQSIFDALSMILPPGIVKPSFHPDVLNDVYSAIKSLLDAFFPFLMIYKFFLPVLNLILCIIEVLCSIPNPFKLIRTLRRLFRVCIPEFLALFPFFALILMIIALLLLILALIEYIIARIILIIETILKNIILLSKAAQSLNNDSIIAIVKKIGDLLCVLQNLFILFAIFNTIIQIIKAIAGLSFRIPPCDSSDGSSDGCCTPDVCPEFIRDNETISTSTGVFVYTGAVGINSGLALPVGFAPFYSYIRGESWQFYDASLGLGQKFINITHAHDLPSEFANTVFFPAGTTYSSSDNYTSVPYYINFQLTYNPLTFGRIDALGTRQVKIKNVVVKEPPKAGVLNYNNVAVAPTNGTLNLIGGVITEMDDIPIFDTFGNPMTVNTFFHRDVNYTGTTLNVGDPVVFTGLTYTFTINHPVLVSHNLITIGCVPGVARERDFLASTIGAQFNTNGIKLAQLATLLPDVGGAQQCISDAITKYRKKISTASTNAFKEEIMTCLGTLRASTVTALTETISAGFDPYKSNFVLDPPIQFTTDTVKVKVLLNDNSGNSMINRLPADAAAIIGAKLKAITSFGEVGGFVYDGVGLFIAEISSKETGNGNITVAYDNSFIGVISSPTDLAVAQTVSTTSLTYTFVKSQVLTDGAVSRDEGDVNRE